MKDRHEWYDPVSNRELACGVSGDPDLTAYTELKHGECYEPKSELVREILRLAAEVERLRTALDAVQVATDMGTGAGGFPHDTTVEDRVKMCSETAREALSHVDGKKPLPEPPDEVCG